MPYRFFPQIDAEMTALTAVGAPGVCRKIPLPNATSSEAPLGPTTNSYLKIANGSGPGRVTVLAIAGMHAREFAQPDAVLSFARKLLLAHKASKAFTIPAYTDSGGSTHGPVSVPAATVKSMVDKLDILLVPCANPDGRQFARTTNPDWRKNRSPRPVGGSNDTVGVDPNRNFDIAWDFDVYYAPSFLSSGRLSASKDPAAINFIGTPASSGARPRPTLVPEVRNLIWILDNHPVTYSIDLHAYHMALMYPWGIEQTGDLPAQNFLDPALDGTRDGLPGTAYREYFPNSAPTRLRDRHAVIAGSMRDRVKAATGRTYQTGPIAQVIYAATGSFTDFHFSRQFPLVGGAPSIHSFAAEFGDAADNFQPPFADPHGFPKVEREVHAVLLALLEAALAPAGSSSGSSSSSSVCLLSVVALTLTDGDARLDTLRRARSRLYDGRRTVGLARAVDRCYRRFSAHLVPRLRERPRLQLLVARLVLVPSSAATARVIERRPR